MGLASFRLCGRGLTLLLDALVTCRVSTMKAGDTAKGFLLDANGQSIDTVGLLYIGRTVGQSQPAGADEYVIWANRGDVVADWLKGAFAGKLALDHVGPAPSVAGAVEITPGGEGTVLDCAPVSLETAQGRALVDIAKPFFVGQRAISDHFHANALPGWEPPRVERPRPLPKTPLGGEHEAIGVSQWGPFGSCTMPIQYAAGPGAIAGEHLATRCRAGLYDVSHMIPIIVKGLDAKAFLQTCLVNDVTRLKVGHCQYQAMCRPAGAPHDDLYLNYLQSDSRSGRDVYLVVANSGHEADFHLLRAIATGQIAIDPDMPFKRFVGSVEFVTRLDARPFVGEWSQPLYSVSIQGPASRDLLSTVVSAEFRQRIRDLEPNRLEIAITLAATEEPIVVTHTGYCGEPVGFECYTTLENLAPLWRALREAGATPCGLGARDSTRQEAGLPLFGHEIDGQYDIPFSGGRYRKLVVFAKPFFVGRRGAWEAERRRKKRVLLLAAEGPRKVSQGWLVYGTGGTLLGQITSTSTIRPGKTDVAQAYLDESAVKTGDRVVVVPPSKAPRHGEAPEGRVFVVSRWKKTRDYGCL